ncbi:MAG: hypothetical protein CVV64_04955 [Candidatus Wallbacteria bacterium HGW-Wallbacteria-1]|jgi:Zn-finger nucleic acid-binding protein|uniref:Transcription factor zinc-finger domain-containing protein n=1 Tax=Candidatus Wallbacteria bacterium HGW-Wallbacteria-1 TaxID=2013854 RepID=A0A2N1PS08_9BACT|nr:MAG: hypothetical protein CVV64_04955 [Candidatus Wallbacteria bacterium HGW-Wallbacteria-1]
MKCPLCKIDSLTPVRPLDFVEIDSCEMCNGLWFDKGELAQLTRKDRDFPNLDEVLKQAHKGEKSCPRCNVPMDEFPYAPNSRLLVDYCTSCEGIWLDPMEFGTVKSISGKTETAAPQSSQVSSKPAAPAAPAAGSGKYASASEAERAERKKILAQMVLEIRRKLGTDMAWECPVCCTETLHQFTTSENITVDLCDTCQGIFFEAGELGDSLEISTDIPGGLERVQKAKVSMKQCPRCKTYMKELPFLEGSDLMIDVCTDCQGIWTDRGEFNKLESLSTIAEDAKSRFLGTCRKLEEKGYVIMGVI